MNKYELKYMIEQQGSITDRLTDTLGKQSTHIQELWTEIGLKNERTTISKDVGRSTKSKGREARGISLSVGYR